MGKVAGIYPLLFEELRMNPSLATAQPAAASLSRALVVLLAFCCGAIVANIYYAQPIVGLIAPDLGLSTEHASLIVSLTQLGYALGLLLLVPLADLLENRRLMVATAVLACVSPVSYTHLTLPTSDLV